MKKFTTFCLRYNVPDPFPVTEHLLCCFAAFMANEGLVPQSIKSYLSALRNTQLSLGLPDPREQSALPVLKRVQMGISRARLGRPQSSKVRLPITGQVLRRVKAELERSGEPERSVVWAVCCVAFFGFFRLGELLLPSRDAFNPRLHLAWGDVAVDNVRNPRMVRCHLKQSKTDQLGRGVDVVLERTGLELCPVAAVLGYIALRGDQSGPFFLTTAKTPLSKPDFISKFRTVLGRLGLPAEDYAGHSFRIGAATSAALAGVEDSMIQLLGRWQSAAFLRYIKTPQERLASISRTIASNPYAHSSRTICDRPAAMIVVSCQPVTVIRSLFVLVTYVMSYEVFQLGDVVA